MSKTKQVIMCIQVSKDDVEKYATKKTTLSQTP